MRDRPKIRAKQMVFNILRNYERLYLENLALKSMLRTLPDVRLRETWEQTLEEVLAQSGIVKDAHAKFERLYTQVSDAIDYEAALGLLLGMPTTEKPS